MKTVAISAASLALTLYFVVAPVYAGFMQVMISVGKVLGGQ